MKSETSWSVLVVSNVLMSLVITFSCVVVAGFAVEGLLRLTRGMDSVGGYRFDSSQIQIVVLEYSVVSGFLMSQVCFALRYVQRGEKPWRIFPFRLRIRLATALALMLAASGILWLNLPTASALNTSDNRLYSYQGWPFTFTEYSSANPAGSQRDAQPDDLNRNYTAAIANVLICGDVLLVLALMTDLFLSRRERDSAAIEAIPTHTGAPV